MIQMTIFDWMMTLDDSTIFLNIRLRIGHSWLNQDNADTLDTLISKPKIGLHKLKRAIQLLDYKLLCFAPPKNRIDQEK